MAPVSDYFYLLSDPVLAALGGLNPLPSLLISAGIGLIPSSKPKISTKALISFGLALGVDALWPMTYGLEPVIPDVFSLVFVINFVILFAISYVIIGGFRLLLKGLSYASNAEPHIRHAKANHKITNDLLKENAHRPVKTHA